jgi:hypothetical protein
MEMLSNRDMCKLIRYNQILMACKDGKLKALELVPHTGVSVGQVRLDCRFLVKNHYLHVDRIDEGGRMPVNYFTTNVEKFDATDLTPIARVKNDNKQLRALMMRDNKTDLSIIDRYNEILRICKEKPNQTFKMLSDAIGISISCIKNDCKFLSETGFLSAKKIKGGSYNQGVNHFTTIIEKYLVDNYVPIKERKTSPRKKVEKSADEANPYIRIIKLEDYQDRYEKTRKIWASDKRNSSREARIGSTLGTSQF